MRVDRQAWRRAVVAVLVIMVFAGCTKVAKYGDDLIRASEAAAKEAGLIGRSTDDIAAAALKVSKNEDVAAAALRGLTLPSTTVTARVQSSVDRIADRIGLDSTQEEHLRGIIVSATCSSIDDAATNQTPPDVAGAIATAVMSEYSPRMQAQELGQSLQDIWEDAEQGDPFGLLFDATMTVCGEAG